MMGKQTLRETKAQVRHAFAERGLDVERWLDEQMAMLKRGPAPSPQAIESMRLIREGLRKGKRSNKGKRAVKEKKTVR